MIFMIVMELNFDLFYGLKKQRNKYIEINENKYIMYLKFLALKIYIRKKDVY